MRRIAVLLSIILAGAACTTAEPEATPTQPVPTTTVSTTLAPTTTLDLCRDVVPDLAAYVAAIGLSHLDLDAAGGPFAKQLPDPDAFADELGAECSGVFYAHSPFGEAAHVVAAWDDERTHAVMGAFLKRGSLATDGDGWIAVVDNVAATYLYPAEPGVLWGEVHDWRATYALEGIVVLAGDAPMASLRAWNRARASVAEYPLVHMESASSWGGNGEIFTVYPSGELITKGPVRSSWPTFAESWTSFQLEPQQLVEIEAMLLATGVTEGERFELVEQNILDAGSLWFRFRHDDLTYIGNVYAPRLGDMTPVRQKVIDLAAHLTELTTSREGTAWVPEEFVVRVVGHGPAPEGNTIAWPGAFDLAAAKDEYCMLLEGEKAEAYLGDVALIGDEYQDRYKTVFKSDGENYSVAAFGLLPGDTDRQFEELSECRTGDVRRSDPLLLAWLWSTRGIDDYRMMLRPECSSCDGTVVLDGETEVAIPGWGDLGAVEDLFALAMRDDVELVTLLTDDFVGLPLTVEVRDPQSGESLRLLTTSFICDQGELSVGHDDQVGISIVPQGFDDWRLEGY